MLDAVLTKLYEENEEMTFKALGTTKTKVKPLIQLKLIEERKIKITKTAPKTPNGAKITEKGIAYLLSSTSDSTKLVSQLNTALKEITQVRNETKSTMDKISSIESSLLKLNQSVKSGGLGSQTPNRSGGQRAQATGSIQDISHKNIVKLLKQFQFNAKPNQKLGMLFSTEIYYHGLNKRLNLNDREINNILYKLYEENKLDLQMGQSKNSRYRGVKTPSGKKYDWGRLL